MRFATHEAPASIRHAGACPTKLAYSIVDGPFYGNLAGTFPNLIYTPFPDITPLDSFIFRVTDSNGLYDEAEVVVSVNSPPNAAPFFHYGDYLPIADNAGYSFEVAIDDQDGFGSLFASDPDGDSLVYSDDNSEFSIQTDGTLIIADGAFLAPGTYVFWVTATDTAENTASVQVEVLVTRQDIGVNIEAIGDATEGGANGGFRLSRSEIGYAAEVTLDIARFDNPGRASSGDFTFLVQGQFYNSLPIVVDFGDDVAEVYIGVFASDDAIEEFIEDLDLQILGTSTSGSGYVEIAALNLVATVLLQDATAPDDEWAMVDNDTYRALKDSASLKNLATIVTGEENDWTAIWPDVSGTGNNFWKQDGADWNTATKKGAKADVSNLIATTGVLLYLFQKRDGVDKYLEGMERWMGSHLAEEQRTQGANYKKANVSSAADIAKQIQIASQQGKTPIARLVIVSHWAEPTVPDSAVDWAANAEVQLNTNDFQHARSKKSPIRSWFTRNAEVEFFGCSTENFAQRVAEEILPVGAEAVGSTAWLFVSKDNRRAGFDQNANMRWDSELESRHATIAEMRDADEWRRFDGEQ